VRVLSISGYVSFQNASTVIEALDELGNFLMASQRSTLSESVTFSKDDLLGGDGLSTHATSLRKPALGAQVSHGPSRGSVPSLKDKAASKGSSRTAGQMSDTDETLNRRAQTILGILKSQGIIGIKDISSNLPEYSEKMIQRELAHLIVLGRVKKSGFKRWSKYAFVR